MRTGAIKVFPFLITSTFRRGFFLWPFSVDYCLDIVGSNSCRIVMEDPTFLLIIMIVKVLTMVGRLSFFYV